MISDEELNRWEHLAKAAAPGPWHQLGGNQNNSKIETKVGTYRVATGGERPYEVGEYISFSSPERIIETLEELKALRAKVNAKDYAFSGLSKMMAVEAVVKAPVKPKTFLSVIRNLFRPIPIPADLVLEDYRISYKRSDIDSYSMILYRTSGRHEVLISQYVDRGSLSWR